jgi:hypothetical protein
MESHSIKFLLFCDWKDFPPTYRLYFNDTLLTERSYLLDNELDILQENLFVFADKNTPHTITIEQIGQQTGTFCVDKLKSDLDINVQIA